MNYYASLYTADSANYAYNLHRGVGGYDLNGNIKSLARTANGGVSDNFTYNYTGNLLASLSGVSGSFTYDQSGNLLNDPRKNLSFTYNSLNLPDEAKSGSTVKAKYLYSYDGVKARVQDAGGTNGYDYLGSLSLVKTSGTQTPECHFGDGIIRGTQVMYFEKDHLGSVRAVLNTAGTVLEKNDYYPFGMRHANASHVVTANNRYKFNGKEDQTVGALGLLDYGARMYDAQIARWLTVDPLADSYYPISPYVYCVNDPVRFIDPNGRDVKPAGTAELIMIQNTLPKDAREYVRLNKDGFIDRISLNAYRGESQNFNNLKTMVNSDRIVEVVLDDQFTFMGNDGQLGTATMSYLEFDPMYPEDKDLTGSTLSGTSTGETGFLGKTLFPDRDGIQNSPNGNIIVIINKHLSPAAAAEMYSHEGNGHALLYILNGGDHKGASHQPIDDKWVDGNKILSEMIIRSKQETIKNMQW